MGEEQKELPNFFFQSFSVIMLLVLSFSEHRVVNVEQSKWVIMWMWYSQTLTPGIRENQVSGVDKRQYRDKIEKQKEEKKGLQTMIKPVAIRTSYIQTVVSKRHFSLKGIRVSWRIGWF